MIFINGYKIDLGKFPDNTLLLKLDLDPIVYFPAEIEWRYENDAELFALICIKRHLDTKFPYTETPSLYLPYLPHARMDRVKDPEDVFTLKYFCEIINSLNFSKICVTDVHSNVGLALLDRVVEENPKIYIEKLYKKLDHPILFFPDEGAMKRYSALMRGTPYAFGMKNRNWSDGKILSLEVINGELVKDKNVLIVDDICSYGGTFFHSAKALKECGAKNIYLFTTHLETSVLKGEMINSGLIDHIYTTPTIWTEAETHEKISFID